ncbi:aspartate--tRNA ligase [Roseivirga pacifica]|uniref:aspartate--tRNA ligase n=1 Tax=Roseivirga pacifica TaxID=1267423 RepID=UPI0020953834|nr:aspartate--tRNA ligase [Roseivirga pacifica]MCO6359525.1 aspartate--tRNA ligase [Roseivirga pacifica]MCO6366895.1 aspartate--tRNA ligase [Roseivirga pacifica]MCO6370573.1 aspartate--tRNA ligase [Roseivirga pacifica]MCO6374552.1 aspartate--tRNA ligase [Roseivirga pacifica]MCO6379810.1 aspartate--tRNA ligase [Roseivirga pacifica]
MLRTHTCGELRIDNVNNEVTLSGWVQKIRDKGGLMWIDLRDRYGVTQLTLEEGRTPEQALKTARELGREFVISVKGKVIERYSKNDKIPTGEVEIDVQEINIQNASKTPPFVIEDETDGGEDLRMKYRYLDLRRGEVRRKLELRSKMANAVRNFLSDQEFIEVETPVLIKSTPEGARDFVVPSRMNPGEFYALPQSPQTFKQLLMVSGFDRYFQIVKCFRDEDLRADRQPEFTQIDCEMSFVERDDVLDTFEGMTRHLFKSIKGVELGEFPRMEYAEAMSKYGSDKPDVRFGMEFVELNDVAQNKGFNVFDQAELVVGICAKGCAEYTRKQLDALTDFVKRPQVGAKGLVYVKCNADGTFKSSVDKFYSQEDLKAWAEKAGAEAGDLMLVLSGATNTTRKQMNELRLHMGKELGLRKKDEFKPLWVVNFPLLEWDEETERFHAMHHPFTSPLKEDIAKLDTAPGEVRANAYDLVINGVEIGGGSIRIHDKTTQALMFKHLGFTPEEAKAQFGFLMDAFEYGAPPHGGIAFGFDRLCAMFGGSDSIRDYIAFPKNTSGRDVMIDSPSVVNNAQLDELGIRLKED